MDDENKSGAMPLTPTYDGAAKPYRRSRASWAIRIVLLVALWLPQPVLLFRELIAGTARYGFLGMWNYALVAAALVVLTALIVVARPRHTPTVVLACGTAALVALCAANAVSASSQFVDEASYDRQTARVFSDDALSNNLEGGYEQYRPFTGESAVRLDEPSTLVFSEDDELPRVDSATALLPLASAFVTATYPQEATTVGWEGQEYQDYFDSGHFDGFMQCYGSGDDSQQPNSDQYESFKAGGGAGNYPEAYREGYVSGWEDALAAQAQGVKWDTAEYWDRVSTYAMAYDDSHAFPSNEAVFQYNNSSTGFMSLTAGDTDVFFGTKSDADQEEYARDRGVEFEYTPVGREGFVFLVNAANPVDSLTVEQVKGIYSGKITNWREVGGPDEAIVAYQRNANSGSQSMMERFMGDVELMDPPSEMHSAGSMSGLVKGIADYDNGKGAIGYSFRYYVTDLVGDYDVKLLAIEGAAPTLENIEDGSYPITGEFFAVTRKGDLEEGHAQIAESPNIDTRQANLVRLVDWIRGEQGQELVVKSGYARL